MSHVRVDTHQPARSPRTDRTAATPWFWQVLGLTACICLGVASEGLAQYTTFSPKSLTFYAVEKGANPPNQTLTLTRTRTNLVTLTASDNASWLISPAPTTYTTSKKVTVAVNTKGLAAGTYKATLTFTVASWSKYYIPVTLIISPATSPPPPSTTSSATLRWNAVTGTPVSGYKVYVGDVPNQYTRTITVGNVTSSTVNSLTVGRMYYFVVTAYNSAGESSPSNQVSKTIQ